VLNERAVDCAGPEPFADRGFMRPELPRHCLVHDRDARRFRSVGGGEVSSFEQRHAKGLEVLGGDACHGDRNAFVACLVTVRKKDHVPAVADRERRPLHERRRVDARDRTNPRERILIEALCLCVGVSTQPHFQRYDDEAFGLEAERSALGRDEAPRQQTADDEEY
jgi:hypothetical protein